MIVFSEQEEGELLFLQYRYRTFVWAFAKEGCTEDWATRCFRRLEALGKVPSDPDMVRQMALDWKRYEDIDGER